MRKDRLKVYNMKNKKYTLVRFLSGIMSPIILLTTLTGCFNNKKDYDDKSKDTDSSWFEYYDEYNKKEEKEQTESNNYYVEDPTVPQETTPNLSLDLDDESLRIIDSQLSLDANSLNYFQNYVRGINVYYPYSELYDTNIAFGKYKSLNKYNPKSPNVFKNNSISSNDLYAIVKKNNDAANLAPVAVLNDSDLKDICVIICDVLNDYISKTSNVDLVLLSEKINNLKITKIDEFSNGYYDAQLGKMGYNVSYLKGKSGDFYKKTIEHETYHFIQSGSFQEFDELNYESRYGISYKFNDININSLNWNWYYEGAAEYLTCNRNNSKDAGVYKDVIKAFDAIKVATILYPGNDLTSFEEISLTSDLNNLFKYFNCKNENEKIEVLNLMYAYNIKFNLNFICDEFYDRYEKAYGTTLSKNQMVKEINNSIAQTLAKQFYMNLAESVKNKNLSVEEIFKLISVFENEISREIWYNSNQDSLTEFFEVYNDIQSEFFGIIAQSLGVSSDDIQTAYNSYNKAVNMDLKDVSFVNNDKKTFYDYILETRKNDKMNSINYVSQKYFNKKR